MFDTYVGKNISFFRLKFDASRYCLTLRMSMTSLLVLWVVCSTRISLTWDAKVFQPYHEHYLSQGTFHGIDVFTEDVNSATGPEMFMEKFYICYDRDGRKTYFKKMDESYFSNRRFWVITAKGSFIASMKTCWRFRRWHGSTVVTRFLYKKSTARVENNSEASIFICRQSFVKESRSLDQFKGHSVKSALMKSWTETGGWVW